MITPYSNIISVTTLEAPFEFTVKTDNAGVSTSTQFRMPLISSTGLNITVDWGDGSALENITVHTNAIHTYSTAGTYTIKVTGSLVNWQFANSGDRLKILNIASWGIFNLNLSVAVFRGCTNLTSSATDAPLITTTSFNQLFDSCSNFNGDISSWNVSLVTSFRQCFISAVKFNQNIGSWNTSSVINMQEMFYAASAFNQNIGSWNVSNVTNFSGFMGAKTAANYSASNLDAIYNGWSSRSVKPNLSISFGSIKYTAGGQAGKDILDFAPNNWTIVDGGI